MPPTQDSGDKSDKMVLLTKLEYCHVINNNTGELRLIEGPAQLNLQSHESLYGTKKQKIIIQDGQYAIILNPYNAEKKDVLHGDRELRVGPLMCALYPGEYIDPTPDGEDHDYIRSEYDDEEGFHTYPAGWNGIRRAYILKFNKGLLIKAIKDFDESIDGKTVKHKAGDLWLVQGPATYIPHKYAMIKRKIKAISLGNNEGIYVKNILSGNIRLVKGPANCMIKPDEDLWEKDITNAELAAIGWINAKGELTIKKTHAYPLWLLENEATMIMDEATQRVEIGPKVVLLEPFERPYIMSISGKTPKVTGALKIWKVRLGPDFMSDRLDVRTKDNADLEITLRYKWKFNVDKEHPERIFKIKDFIGFATETMSGIIRNIAAQHNFEQFHSGAADIIKESVFGSENKPYLFEINGFEIFDIDIKKIAPKDAKIAEKLNTAITSNMEVYVEKIKQQAKMDAERDRIKGLLEVENSRKQLIEIQNNNTLAEKIGVAKADSVAKIESANADAESVKIRTKAEVDSINSKMEATIKQLNIEGGEKYLKLREIETLGSIKKMVIPADSKLIAPSSLLDE